MDAMTRLLASIRDQDPSERVVIVSNFTSTLDLIAKAADERDWVFVRLDGKIQQSQVVLPLLGAASLFLSTDPLVRFQPHRQRQALVDRFNTRNA